MAESAASSVSSIKPEVNVIHLNGLIEDVNEYNGKIYTMMKLPSEDRYGDSQSVQVRSDKRFASKGEETSVKAKIGGWNRGFKRKDGSDGTQNTLTLDAVLD